MKLIDKDKLEAFLNELIENLGDSDFDRGYLCAIDTIFGCYLNTLEVKGVDLDKELNDFIEQQKAWIKDDRVVEYNNEDSFNHIYDLEEIAKHFFELGLKAKVEEV